MDERLEEWLGSHGYFENKSTIESALNFSIEYVNSQLGTTVTVSSTRGDMDVFFAYAGVVGPTAPDIWLYAVDGTPISKEHRANFDKQAQILIEHYPEFLIIASSDNSEEILRNAGRYSYEQVTSLSSTPLLSRYKHRKYGE